MTQIWAIHRWAFSEKQHSAR